MMSLKNISFIEKRKQRYLMLIPICLFLSNIKLVSVFDHGFRPMELLLPICSFVFLLSQKRIKGFVGFLFFSIFPLLSLFNVVSGSNFFFSYALYFLEIFFLFAFATNIDGISPYRREAMIRLTFQLMFVCVVFGAVQFVFANVFRTKIFYNFLGNFQYHPNYENELAGITRACSIFYEPSVFGWMCVFVYALNEFINIGQNKMFYRIFLMVGIAISFSSSAIVGLGGLILFASFTSKKGRIFGIFVLLAGILLILVSNTNIFSFLRLNTVGTEGSSGYNRLTYPIDATIQTFKVYPLFGRGLGQIGIYDSKIKNYSDVFNAVFGIFVTFGLSGLFIYLFLFKYFAKWMMVNRTSMVFCYTIIFLLLSNGSFVTLEFPIIFVLFNIAVSLCKNKKSAFAGACVSQRNNREFNLLTT